MSYVPTFIVINSFLFEIYLFTLLLPLLLLNHIFIYDRNAKRLVPLILSKDLVSVAKLSQPQYVGCF